MVAIFIFLASQCFYIYNMAPAISSGDSAELATAGITLGIAHSPGYPLYVLVTKCVAVIVPWASQAYRANFVSALFSSGAAAVASVSVTALTGKKFFGFVVGLLLAFSPTWLNQAQAAEVFALNTFFAAIILYFVIRFSQSIPPSSPFSKGGQKGDYPAPAVYLLSFLLGLGLGNHHTLILVLPSLVVAGSRRLQPAFFSLRRLILKDESASPPEPATTSSVVKPLSLLVPSPKSLVPVVIFFLLGLSVYLYIPIRSLQEPLLDWEDPQTWQRFVDLVTRARYGTFQIAQGSPHPLTLERCFALAGYFAQTIYRNLGLAGAFLILVALIRQAHRMAAIMLVLVAGLFFTGPVFLLLANILPGTANHFLLDRFMPLPLLFGGIILSAGISEAWEFLSPKGRECFASRRTIMPGSGKNSATAIAVVFAALVLAPRITEGVTISKRFSYDLWHNVINVLRTLPDGAMLFSDRADETEFSLAYLTTTQNLKKNVKFIDCNAGVSKSIYGDDYYRIWGKPRLAIRQEVESRIVAEAKRQTRPVFYATVDTSQINLPRTSEGILFRAVTPSRHSFGKLRTASERSEESHSLFRAQRGISSSFLTTGDSSALPQNDNLYWDWNELYLKSGTESGLKKDTRLAAVELSNLKLLGDYFFSHGKTSEAETEYRNMASWGDEEWLVKLAYAYYEHGYKPGAKKAYRSAIIRNPHSASAYSALGSLCLEDGEIMPAEHFLARAVKLAPDDVQFNYNLAALYWRQRRWPEAVKIYEHILAMSPNHADAMKFLEQARTRNQKSSSKHQNDKPKNNKH